MQESIPQSVITSKIQNLKIEDNGDSKQHPHNDDRERETKQGNNDRDYRRKSKGKSGNYHRPHENKTKFHKQEAKEVERNNKRDVPAERSSAKTDPKIESIKDDPRNPNQRITKKANNRGKGRNTESFDPASTFVRPDLRIQIGSNSINTFNKPLKHDDVVIVPELFGAEDDWTTYYTLVDEMRDLQTKQKDAEWISWHEGAHLISNNPQGCPTYERIIERLCQYFKIDKNKKVGTRFNWYRDSQDWKPFHHDSAAYNPFRARSQNITVGVSFGATRELAFLRAGKNDEKTGDNCKLYFPQVNNGTHIYLFQFHFNEL